MKKVLFTLMLILASAGIKAQGWTAPADGAYNHRTVLYLSLSDIPGYSPTDGCIGAFINDECRGSARYEMPPVGGPGLFTLEVWGDVSKDNGATITLKYCNMGAAGHGLVYQLPQTFIYDGNSHGEPSAPVALSLNVPTTYALTLTDVEVGKSYDLTQYLTYGPEGTMLPENLTFSLDETVDLSPYITLSGSTLTGNSPYEGIKVHLLAPDGFELATGSVNVVLYPTGIALKGETSVTVNKNDMTALTGIMNSCYTILPDGATANVQWETEDATILQWSDTFGGFNPIKGGTTRMRPYFISHENLKITPADDAWITVTVRVPVTNIFVNKAIFGDSFIANVGDTKIYERLAKMVTIEPEDATDKTFSVEPGNIDVIGVVGPTSLKALNAGTSTLIITSNDQVTDPTMGALSTTTDIVVQNPPTEITLTSNQLNVVLTDGNPKDISEAVRANVALNGDAALWPTCATVSLTGSGVMSTGAIFSPEGLTGSYTAAEVGTATVTVALSVPDYDNWDGSAPLAYQNVEKSFNIVVTNSVSLTHFNVTVTNAVAGRTGTITFTPQPEGATFDPDNITVTIKNPLEEIPTWSNQFTTKVLEKSTTQIVYEFWSSIPNAVAVEAKEGTKRIPLNDPASITINGFLGFEIGWPLTLGSGWQWRSNACGFIPSERLEQVYTSDKLIEIRTQSDLLYNDPSWGYYGTLMSTSGLKQYECYKLKMKEARDTVLYASSILSSELQVAGTVDATSGSVTVTLSPGWNWVGFPYFFSRSLTKIMPVSLFDDETVVVGKEGSAELGNGQWNGTLTTLQAGQGYLIKNPSQESKQLVFPVEATLLPVDETPAAGARSMDGSGSVWRYDHSRFMNNMTMVAVLASVSQPERYSIGAFVGDECRGEGVVTDGLAFITVHCDAGEAVRFRLYDTYTSTCCDVVESLKAQTRVGSLKRPYVLHASQSTLGISDITNNGETTNNNRYDLLGRSVSNSRRGITVSRTASGTYRKVIVK